MTFAKSFLAIGNTPETATGELLLASAMRHFVLGITERSVIARRAATGPTGLPDTPFTELMRSPRRKRETGSGQSVYPLTPAVAAFASAARQRGNPFNPGGLIARALWWGAGSSEAYVAAHSMLRELLQVTDADDPWAIAVESQFRPLVQDLPRVTDIHTPDEPDTAWACGAHPGAMLIQDLQKLAAVKQRVTRRQLATMTESILRIGASAHTLWLMQLTVRSWHLVEAALDGESPPADCAASLALPLAPICVYGAESTRTITDAVRAYMIARVSLETVLDFLEEAPGKRVATSPRTPDDFAVLLKALSRLVASDRQAKSAIQRARRKALRLHTRDIDADTGTGRNLRFFFLYALAPRDTIAEAERECDQGYWIRKDGLGTRARFRFEAGPVALVTMAHCIQSERGRLATFGSLCSAMARYGIDAKQQTTVGTRLEIALRRLGFTSDSPDAEMGMVINDPLAKVGAA